MNVLKNNREILENKLKNLKEIYEFQIELGEDTKVVEQKIKEIERLLAK